jgi:hypothetical protein
LEGTTSPELFTGEEYPYSKPLPYMPYICINLKKVDSLQKAIPQEMSSNILVTETIFKTFDGV